MVTPSNSPPTPNLETQELTLNDITRAYLNRTHARCVACNYPLRGIEELRCPECGLEVRLGLRNARGSVEAQSSSITTSYMLGSLAMSIVWGITTIMLTLSSINAAGRSDPLLWRWLAATGIALTCCVGSVYFARSVPRAIQRHKLTKHHLIDAFIGVAVMLAVLAAHLAGFFITLTYVMP